MFSCSIWTLGFVFRRIFNKRIPFSSLAYDDFLLTSIIRSNLQVKSILDFLRSGENSDSVQARVGHFGRLEGHFSLDFADGLGGFHIVSVALGNFVPFSFDPHNSWLKIVHLNFVCISTLLRISPFPRVIVMETSAPSEVWIFFGFSRILQVPNGSRSSSAGGASAVSAWTSSDGGSSTTVSSMFSCRYEFHHFFLTGHFW